MKWLMIIMCVSGITFGIIGWYTRNRIPGKYGVAQPWYFPVSPSYWGCCSGDKKKKRYSNYEDAPYDDELPGRKAMAIEADFKGHDIGPGEPDPKDLPVGISLHHFTKYFKDGRVHAVDDLTVNFFQDQITAFLGQNGAGKTTTINMLTGIFPPSKGVAYVNGRSVLSDFTDIRKDLGVCPQFDVLFDYLTVWEHLRFYASLKGNSSKKQLKADIQRMLDVTGLRSSMHVKTSQLSGGQKRRLSVALAFIGGSKVVILDEPTSGVDPAARRKIWDLIVQHRHSRTILLCTHHLDEADILGDRIVILHKGKLVCSGSPMFLKSEYGSGYHLTMAKHVSQALPASPSSPPAYTECDSSQVLSFIKSHLPQARLVEEIGSELSFILPTDHGQVAKFQTLFEALERSRSELHIGSYGVSDTTLEEVFLKLTMQAEHGESISPGKLKELTLKDTEIDIADGGTDANKTVSSSLGSDTIDQTIPSLKSAKPLSGAGFKFNQFKAIFLKRFHHHKRDFRSYMSQIIMPCLFICLAMGVTLIKPKPENMPPLKLSPDLYARHSFYSMDAMTDWNLAMRDSMLEHPYLGTSCMEESPFVDRCSKEAVWKYPAKEISKEDYSKYENPEPCTCDYGRQSCPEGAGGFPPEYLRLPTGGAIHNLTDVSFPMEDYLLKTHTDNINRRYGGWTFDTTDDGQSKATVWFNNKGWHAMPSYYNALHNMVLRAAVNGDPAEYGISVYNHPMNLTQGQLSDRTFIQGIADTGIALTILCAFCFVPAGYTIYLIDERINHEKRLQMINGVGVFLYWFTAFVWDMMSYLFTVGLATIIAAAFQIDIYNARLNLAAFVVSLIMFGWATIPLMYMMVRMFKNTATGYMVMFILNLIVGIVTTACVFLLSLFEYIPEIAEANGILSKVFLIFPQFCLGDSLVQLSRNQLISEVYARFQVDKYKNPFTFDMIAWHFVAMAVEGVVFFILALIIDSAPAACSSEKPPKYIDPRAASRRIQGDHHEDEDVGLERQRVVTGEARKDLMVLHNLRKLYNRGLSKVMAVDNVCVGIPKGECFGLLGVNGAGKTTTFNMITGEVGPTAGVALLNGKVISENESNMKRNVGYCPQTDALDGFLTGKEMIYFAARLKGIPDKDIRRINKALMNKLGLQQWEQKTVKGYSGGTKRKLSTAIALLGEPEIVLMDEPTTGMDPQTRRLVWNNITKVIKDNRSVVLTSHSMAECDALCTRMAIMVNGRLKCLGNGQQLKNRFGVGYTLKLRVEGDDSKLSNVQTVIESQFPGTYLKDAHRQVLVFQMPASAVALSSVFGYMEAEKGHLNVIDYSVSQTTLDQVFLSFAREQTDGTVEDDKEDGGTPPHKKEYEAYVNSGYESWGELSMPGSAGGRSRYSGNFSQHKPRGTGAQGVVSPNEVVLRPDPVRQAAGYANPAYERDSVVVSGPEVNMLPAANTFRSEDGESRLSDPPRYSQLSDPQHPPYRPHTVERLNDETTVIRL